MKDWEIEVCFSRWELAKVKNESDVYELLASRGLDTKRPYEQRINPSSLNRYYIFRGKSLPAKPTSFVGTIVGKIPIYA